MNEYNDNWSNNHVTLKATVILSEEVQLAPSKSKFYCNFTKEIKLPNMIRLARVFGVIARDVKEPQL